MGLVVSIYPRPATLEGIHIRFSTQPYGRKWSGVNLCRGSHVMEFLLLMMLLIMFAMNIYQSLKLLWNYSLIFINILVSSDSLQVYAMFDICFYTSICHYTSGRGQ